MSTEQSAILDINGRPYDSTIDKTTTTFPWAALVLWCAVACLGGGILGWHIRDYSAHNEIASIVNPQSVVIVNGTPAANEWDKRPILAPPQDAPPAMVRVVSEWYTVNYTSREALAYYNALALTDHNANEIWLNPKRSSVELRKDIMHELMHCAFAVGNKQANGASWGDAEENFIQRSSDEWLDILRDNKLLLVWWLKK